MHVNGLIRYSNNKSYHGSINIRGTTQQGIYTSWGQGISTVNLAASQGVRMPFDMDMRSTRELQSENPRPATTSTADYSHKFLRGYIPLCKSTTTHRMWIDVDACELFMVERSLEWNSYEYMHMARHHICHTCRS